MIGLTMRTTGKPYMPTDSSPEFPSAATTTGGDALLQERCGVVVARMKERQCRKIRELRDALVTEGFLTLDQQAKVLGLSRSTTWTVLRGNHKGSGLSAAIINRMLAAPQLPARVRNQILGYVEEKAAGLYGHGKAQRRRFSAQLSISRVGRPDLEGRQHHQHHLHQTKTRRHA
jgi:predicted DNA-binding transcriptional regulator AlpA